MGDYGAMRDEFDETEILNRFPKINARKLEWEINALFKSYLFFRDQKGTREIQASCCGKTVTLPRRTMSQSDMQAFYGRHNEEAICPLCGKAGTLKNICRLGKKKRLPDWQPVVILKARRGELYARAYWARKNYQELTAPPQFMLAAAYHFKPGRAVMYQESWLSGKWSARVCEGRYNPNQRTITEPFVENCMGGYRYLPYHVFGLDQIERSGFRYCLYGENIDKSDFKWDLMKYLAACCIWPRDIEMLQKMGLVRLVEDLICGRKLNKAAYTWGAGSPQEAFDLDGQELRAWMEYKDLDMLQLYKRLRRKKLRTSFETLHDMEEAIDSHNSERAVKLCCQLREKPEKLMRYLSDYMADQPFPLRRGFEMWQDYISILQELNRDLTPHNVRFPSNLTDAHDAAAEELAAMLRQRAAAERRKAEKERLQQAALNRELVKNREKRLNFELGDYFIRVAVSAEEVRAEGEALQHCVAGYAYRHMEGQTTILFLRKRAEPNKPLYTIEVLNGRLKQVHGFRNDANQPDPRITMAWILDPWIDWWKSGSRRDKQGKPILKQEVKTA